MPDMTVERHRCLFFVFFLIVVKAVIKSKGSSLSTDSPSTDPSRMVDMSPSLDSPMRSSAMLTPDSDAMEFDVPAAVMPDTPSVQLRQHPVSYDMYRSVQPANGMGLDHQPQQQQQFYLHEPSPSRRTWGQPQPMGPSPMAPQALTPQSMPYGQPMDGGMYANMPMRRAQWGTPQPVIYSF